MINSTNIRVGNLCFKDGEVHVITALDILNIDECESRNSFHGFTPIPLIETWLEKLGFEKIFQTDRRKVFDYYLDHRFGYNDNFGFKNISSCVTFVGNTFDHIKYVHQLQNLYYSITENELKLIKK